MAASRPAVKSAMAMPPARRGISSPGRASASSSPEQACATRSNAVSSASGPSLPSAETTHHAARGLTARTLSRSSP